MPPEDDFTSLSAWRVRLEEVDDELAALEQRLLTEVELDHGAIAQVNELREQAAQEWDRLATRYDAWARTRDLAALGRDVLASGRDVAKRAGTSDADDGFPNRWLSAVDRDESSGDRADSLNDRLRGAEARDRAEAERIHATTDRKVADEHAEAQDQQVAQLRQALSTRGVIGQAIGLIMARRALSSDDALALLTRSSQEANIKLRDVAVAIVADAQPPAT